MVIPIGIVDHGAAWCIEQVAADPAEVRWMRLEGIQAGDIVEVDCKGRRFYAVVTGPAPGGLALAPIDRRVNHYSARSREVVGHWLKRGRPRTTTAPLRPSERQLEIDLGIQPQSDDA
jgi:hypothetical protein